MNARNSWGITPFHSVVKRPTVGKKEKTLVFQIARLLFENGADINTRDDEGDTPLHSVKTKPMLKLLIENGADIKAKNKEGKTPLDVICCDARDELISMGYISIEEERAAIEKMRRTYIKMNIESAKEEKMRRKIMELKMKKKK